MKKSNVIPAIFTVIMMIVALTACGGSAPKDASAALATGPHAASVESTNAVGPQAASSEAADAAASQAASSEAAGAAVSPSASSEAAGAAASQAASSEAADADGSQAESSETMAAAEPEGNPAENVAASESAPETASAEAGAEAAESPEAPAAHSDILVAYFSATGTTKGVAERIASVTGGDLYAIQAAVPYTAEDLNYNDRSTRATVEQNDSKVRPELGGEDISLNGYTTLYLGYPIWWGEEPRIMDTFVEKYSFEGITVIPFCTSGGSGIGRSGKNMETLAGSGTWLEGRRFSGNVSEADLQSWIDGLK